MSDDKIPSKTLKPAERRCTQVAQLEDDFQRGFQAGFEAGFVEAFRQGLRSDPGEVREVLNVSSWARPISPDDDFARAYNRGRNKGFKKGKEVSKNYAANKDRKDDVGEGYQARRTLKKDTEGAPTAKAGSEWLEDTQIPEPPPAPRLSTRSTKPDASQPPPSLIALFEIVRERGYQIRTAQQHLGTLYQDLKPTFNEIIRFLKYYHGEQRKRPGEKAEAEKAGAEKAEAEEATKEIKDRAKRIADERIFGPGNSFNYQMSALFAP